MAKGIRYWINRAESHAVGILDSCDDEAFWGNDCEAEDFYADEKDASDRIKARKRIYERISKTMAATVAIR